ncbi:MAG: type VI secretion system-associated FHA domain protein TagH [Paracoccus sp. (in: a-proteobacteria)]|uniref:type VI secretion system-associated FHA domain protein TagH n=1 Tax=Paracoccus sp. TaxID=267 RepID=UPI0026DFD15A|nr:type VI secretion system-associated FHA domain protein TagH [Paracoccus sp. (in: a-proteobacteria)]MDO5622914.1 type VI secretion system-associated FHA domain protein TagH [Paracoccus sp. (in: a-proteobacteria)]
MTLTLQIENFHTLDDGGPISVEVPVSGLQVGRAAGMGWVLPDASRYISGHHFDVTFDGQTWWLRDLSTNGTYLQGQEHRLSGPHALRHGDHFEVGHYLIVAIFDRAQEPALSPASLPEHQVKRVVDEIAQDDPWAIGGFDAPPIDPYPVGIAARHADFADDFIALPDSAPPAAPPPTTEAEPVQAIPPAPVLDDAPFLRGFCEGAGLDHNLPSDTEALGRAVGAALRVTAQQLMQALQDRSAARHFTRAGERTMRGASDNNPLKFLPDSTQALEALFLRPRAGFLTGAAGFDLALGDLRRHQAALFAALQPALIGLIQDMEPDRIAAEAGNGGLTGNRKAKAWDSYVSRWDARASGENGILDEFIRLFAEAYRAADQTAAARPASDPAKDKA